MKIKQSTFLSTTTLALCAAALMLAPRGMAADKDTLDATDVAFVKNTAAAGMAEVKIADLAVTKASSADVRAFAEMISADHKKANDELTKLAATKGVEPSAVISPEHAETFQQLEKYSGAEFDKEFLKVMVGDHKTCISKFESAAKDSKDGDVKAWADKMLSTLRAHRTKAVELQDK